METIDAGGAFRAGDGAAIAVPAITMGQEYMLPHGARVVFEFDGTHTITKVLESDEHGRSMSIGTHEGEFEAIIATEPGYKPAWMLRITENTVEHIDLRQRG